MSTASKKKENYISKKKSGNDELSRRAPWRGLLPRGNTRAPARLQSLLNTKERDCLSTQKWRNVIQGKKSNIKVAEPAAEPASLEIAKGIEKQFKKEMGCGSGRCILKRNDGNGGPAELMGPTEEHQRSTRMVETR